MAPANRAGYALLPTSDISEAGGPVRPVPPSRPLTSSPRPQPPRQPTQPSPSERSGPAHVPSTASIEFRPHKQLSHRYDLGRRFDKNASWYVLHPHVTPVQIWFLILTLLLLLDLVYIPLELGYACFMDKDVTDRLNTITTALFTIDIVLNFFLQVPSKEGDFWIYDHATIVKAYLRGSFAIDVLSVIPMSMIDILFAFTNGKLMWLLRLLRSVKLLRLFRLARMNNRYAYEWSLSYAKYTALRAGTALIFSIHMMSCAWAMLAEYQLGQDWLEVIEQSKTHDEWDFYATADGKRRPAVIYVTATYFTLYTLTGVGYGDITPTTPPEFWCASALMLVASVIWAMVIGQIVNIMKHASHDELEHRETIDQLIAMGEAYKLSQDLKLKLKSFFKHRRYLTSVNFMQEEVLAKMTSEMAIEVVSELHGPWLDHVWWLHNVRSSSFMVPLTLAFDPALYCPEEMVKPTDRLFVVRRGLCMHGTVVLTKDMIWGLDCLLLQGHLKRLRTTIAMSYLHVLFLTRDRLEEILADYPKERRIIRRSYRNLCVMRGVVHRARQLLAEEKRHKSENGGGGAEPLRSVEVFPSQHTAKSSRWRSESGFDSNLLEQAHQRIDSLEGDLAERMERIEASVRESLEAINAFLGGRKGSRLPSRPGSPSSTSPRSGARIATASSPHAAAGVRHLLD